MKTRIFLPILFFTLLYSCDQRVDCIRDYTLTSEYKARYPYKAGDTTFFTDQYNNQYYLTCTSINDSTDIFFVKSGNDESCKTETTKYTYLTKYFKSNLPSDNNSQFNQIYIQISGSGASIHFDFLSNNLTCEQYLAYSSSGVLIDNGRAYASFILKDSIVINNNNYYKTYILFHTAVYADYPCQFYDTIYFNFTNGFLKFVSTKNNLIISKK